MVARKSSAAFAAVVVFASGMLPAVISARSVAKRDTEQSREALDLASTQVASTLRLGIGRAEGLVVNASAYVAGNSTTTPAQFARWATSARVLQRYPELQDLGLIVLVPDRELAAFQARMLANPIPPSKHQPAGAGEDFRVLPQGRRPYYCLAAAGVVRSEVTAPPSGLDYCAVEPTLLRARDSAQVTYVPFKEGSVSRIGMQTPVYRSAATPSTVPARRRAFVGWLGESLAPKVLLTAALQGRPHMAVTLRFRAAGRDVSFASGPPPAHAQTSSSDLHNGWTVQTFAPPAGGGLLADRRALEWLGGGMLLSLLAAALVFVLGTGRKRTSELAYRAQHDSLTGLPNRSLVLEHAERLFAHRQLAAVMFIDVDGFKQVNDGFGHAAGDALLKAVAGRLRAAIRLQDMVARLGGDEFLVLLDSSAGEPQAEQIAQRIVQAVREPICVCDGIVVSVGASVGVSTRTRASVSDVLHDADVAVYAAKAAGKGCYRVFQPGMVSAIAEPASASTAFEDGEREAAPSREREAVLVA